VVKETYNPEGVAREREEAGRGEGRKVRRRGE